MIQKILLPKFIKRIEAYADEQYDSDQYINRQFKIAVRTLKCTNNKIYSETKYVCKSNDLKFSSKAEAAVTRLNPPFMPALPAINLPGIKLGSGFFYRSSRYRRISTIINELSHKCGSGDGGIYYVEENKIPNHENTMANKGLMPHEK